MKALTKKDLFALLAIQSESGACGAMSDHVAEVSKKLGATVSHDSTGNLYVEKGTGEGPAVVAHLDTVHAIQAGDLIPVEIGGRVTGINSATMRQSGIGGDDKCGIWAALRCIEACPTIRAGFFVDEEIGCVGSYRADIDFFTPARFILQADRRGNGDFVRDIGGRISSKAFQKAAAPFLRDHGFKYCSGAMTDVMALSETGVGVSCANISAGYYNPHTAGEFIHLADLENAVSLMIAICHNLTERFPYVHRPRPSYWHTPPASYSKKPATTTAAENMALRWRDWEREPARVDPWDDLDWKKREETYLDWYRQQQDTL